MNILESFCDIDDFCQSLPPFVFFLHQPALKEQAGTSPKTRNRATGLHLSEIMTILIAFHQSGYRQFKAYYKTEIKVNMKGEFPNAPSYSRFIELMPEPCCIS